MLVLAAHTALSGNRDGLHQLLSHNISATRPSITMALAVCLAGHLIRRQQEHAFQFTACAMILLRNTGGGGDLGSASVTLADLRSACVKGSGNQSQSEHNSAAEAPQGDWSLPGTAEWARVLEEIEGAFARGLNCGGGSGAPQALSIGIIELAMVVQASKFIHTIMAPPPPAAAFINFTVKSLPALPCGCHHCPSCTCHQT